MLRLGGAEVKISFLELMDDDVGPRGAMALGMSMSKGHNLSLLTLKLDFNTLLGSQGLYIKLSLINFLKLTRTFFFLIHRRIKLVPWPKDQYYSETTLLKLLQYHTRRWK